MMRVGALLGLIGLPLLAVGLDWPLWLTILALLGLLALGWLGTLARLSERPPEPELCLESISASHFVEKVRWCMDRLGVAYTEQVWAGTLGAFYKGRSVPTLHVGRAATLGNSSDILRYLWGCYGTQSGERAEFLRPTQERLSWEQRLDQYGVDLQRWVYAQILPHKAQCLRAWGVEDPRVPGWQRAAIRLLFPLHRILIRKAFRITPGGVEKSRSRIRALLGDVDTALADGPTLTGEDQPSFADFTFAALSGLWLQPANYAAGTAHHFSVPVEELPEGWRLDREAWTEAYPRASQFIADLYEQERL